MAEPKCEVTIDCEEVIALVAEAARLLEDRKDLIRKDWLDALEDAVRKTDTVQAGDGIVRLVPHQDLRRLKEELAVPCG